MGNKIVQVVMSTYNGEQYIKEQIESILQQQDVQIRLLIRDDGSTDATLDIIRQYALKYENVVAYEGPNVGPCKSFFDLLSNVDVNAQYYAFADQDDVWKLHKLSRAIRFLEECGNVPALYAGSYDLVDSNLNKISRGNKGKKIVSFGNSLIECIYPGCAGVFNKSLLELVNKKLPENAYMHDWWLYMAASAMGKVIYDEEASVLYRQHEKNVLGDKTGKIQHILQRVNNFKNLRNYVPRQVAEFGEIFDAELTEQQQKLIKCIASETKNPLMRMRIFSMKDIRRNKTLDNILYKIMYLFWRV